jgi:hypothetical protein
MLPPRPPPRGAARRAACLIPSPPLVFARACCPRARASALFSSLQASRKAAFMSGPARQTILAPSAVASTGASSTARTLAVPRSSAPSLPSSTPALGAALHHVEHTPRPSAAASSAVIRPRANASLARPAPIPMSTAMSLATAIAGTLPPPSLEAVVARAAPFFAATPLFAAQFEASNRNGAAGGARRVNLGAIRVDDDAHRDTFDGIGESDDDDEADDGVNQDAPDGNSTHDDQFTFAREVKIIRRKFQYAPFRCLNF